MFMNRIKSLLIFSTILIMETGMAQNVITTASGLQYKITQKGIGEKPEVGDMVSVHYTGKLTNDSVFDSSIKRGEPITFTLGKGQVIKGWDEGIALMHVGDKAVFTIPAQLGYGSQAQGTIPANSTLIFDVELMKIVKAPKPYDVKGKDTIALADGLKIIKLNTTNGDQVKKGGIVSIQYSAFLSTGEMFDSSIPRGQSLDFPIGDNAVFAGLELGLQQMKVGEKAKLLIPSKLGFGSRQTGNIPANSDLIFDVEVVGYKVKEQPVAYDVAGKETITTASGLKYIISKPGTGVKAIAGKKVKVNYTGYFEDGKIFDSSFNTGNPFSFQLGAGQVIKGWDEGVALMSVGGKIRLIVPYQLGYGENGYGPIPAKATLTFDVELLDVEQ